MDRSAMACHGSHCATFLAPGMQDRRFWGDSFGEALQGRLVAVRAGLQYVVSPRQDATYRGKLDEEL